ncbi:MAG: glycosyltransferase [Cytophaga sp.]|uniref:glycosyltransferase n=1 Tax=Cytophaga sp. TaxID=29535 RepID=UPI003F80E2B0
MNSNTFILLTCYLSGTASIIWLLIQLSAVLFRKKPDVDTHKEGVSVVIAAHNEIENLKRFLPSILNQSYPAFEVIIACDRCNDGSQNFLQSLSNPALKYIDIQDIAAGMNPKKAALDTAIRQAVHPWILLTDADCYPLSDQWISSMMETKGRKEICLGISLYAEKKTLLNRLIRFETLFTALNYISWAILRKPYMAVGRNLLYKKELFINNGGFGKHAGHLGGDDDLLIQKIASGSNSTVNISKFGITLSQPAEGFSAWWKQKHRHLHAGKQYPMAVLLGLSIYPFLSSIYYISLIYSLFSFDFKQIMLFYILRTCIFISIFVCIGQKLNARLPILFLTIAEILYLNYLLFAGFYNLVVPIKKWK